MANDVLASALTHLDQHGTDEISMLTVVTQLSTRETLSAVLQSLLARPQKLKSMLPIAIHHANGFHKLVLATDGRSQIRLHMWPQEISGRLHLIENAHNHRWSFASIILHGSYTETTYAQTTGSMYSRYTYSHAEDEIDYRLHRTETCNLITTGMSKYSIGSTHWIHPQVIHRVSPVDPQELTATLLVVAPSQRPSTDVFVAREATNAVGHTKHRPLTTEEIVDSLTALANVLGPHSNS